MDCKSAARKALLVRLQSSPPRANRNLATQALSQCLLVSMGDIETNTNSAPLAQLVRSLACHARGQGFESPTVRHYYRELGEWLNQQIANLSFRNGCVGSNPTLSANYMGVMLMLHLIAPSGIPYTP